MPKFRADVNVGSNQNPPVASSTEEHTDPHTSEAEAGSNGPDLATTVTTIGVIGVAAALVDLALLPGMIIGVAAAYAPKYVPTLGDRLQPLFNYTVRGAYKVTRKARSAVAETQERMHDLAAEVEAEEAAQANGASPAHVAS